MQEASMRTRLILLVTAFATIIPLRAQTQAPSFQAPALKAPSQAPSSQTPRQALIEMFLGHEPESFEKHLPRTTRKFLSPNGEEPYASVMFLISLFNRRFLWSGNVKTFDAGPTILVSERNELDRLEVAVERDAMTGETDEIELSFHLYHDGREQPLSTIPRLSFTLKQEKEIWRLAQVMESSRVPLTDPGYLSGLRQQQQEGNESNALMRINAILLAETGYAALHPERGYVCSLTALFAPAPQDSTSEDNSTDDNSDQPQVLNDPGAGSSEWSGYLFVLTGCEGSPGSKYQVTAAPIDSDSGTKTFCADESGTVKSAAGKRVSDCLGRGEALTPENDPVTETQL
jgi:hypothetical protein